MRQPDRAGNAPAGSEPSAHGQTDKNAAAGIYRLSSMGLKLVLILAGIHLAIALHVITNNLSHKAIVNAAESEHALFAYQFGAGERLYGPMDIHVRELWYTPLTFQITGWVSKWFGYDIRAMRFVIAVAGVSAMIVLGLLTYRLTRNKAFAFIAAALLAGIDTKSWPWFTMLDPNALHVLGALIGVYLFVRDRSLRWPTVILATLAFFASYWSKQTGLAYIAAGVFYCLVTDWRKGMVSAALAFALVAGSAAYYLAMPDSSFFTALAVHKNNPIVWQWLLEPALFPEIIGRFGVLIAAVIAGLVGIGLNWRKWIQAEYIFLGASAVVAVMTRIKYGSGPTQGIFFSAMLFACSLAFLQQFLQERLISGRVLLSLVALQCFALFHEYRAALITPSDDLRFEMIKGVIATPGKDVFYNCNGFYNVLVGKQPYPSVGRNCWSNGRYDRSLYPDYFRKWLEKDPFDIVISDVPLEDNSWFLYERLDKNYVAVREIPAESKFSADYSLRNRKVIFFRKDQVPSR
jgi:hypothetical protein